jgi:hypothetical protein
MKKLLNKNRHNPRVFWNLSAFAEAEEILMHHSIAYRLSCLRKIRATWYKDLPYKGY